jgi:hypothetical protein
MFINKTKSITTVGKNKTKSITLPEGCRSSIMLGYRFVFLEFTSLIL